jgi:hypothetical protein
MIRLVWFRGGTGGVQTSEGESAHHLHRKDVRSMNNQTTSTNEDSADREKSAHNPSGQALQINDNTIDDPKQPEATNASQGHSRRDVETKDQAIQINENTIDDPD